MHLEIGETIERRISQIYPGLFDISTINGIEIIYKGRRIRAKLPNGKWTLSGAQDSSTAGILKGTLNDSYVFEDGIAIVEGLYLGPAKEPQTVNAHQVNMNYAYCRDSALAIVESYARDENKKDLNGIIVYLDSLINPETTTRWTKYPGIDLIVHHGIIFFGNYGKNMIDAWEMDRNFLKCCIDIKASETVNSSLTQLVKSRGRGYIGDVFYLDLLIENTEKLSVGPVDSELQKGAVVDLDKVDANIIILSTP